MKEHKHSDIHSHHHHHQSLNREGHWGTTDDFATSFLHFSLFSTALWDLPNSRPVHSLMMFSHLFLCPPCLLPPFLEQDAHYAGQAGCLEDFFIWHTVLPFDAKDGNASSIVETTQVAWVLCHNLACACQGNTAVNIASLIKSMMSWRHLACWQLCTSGASFFCSLLVKSKPTWLRNGKLKS